VRERLREVEGGRMLSQFGKVLILLGALIAITGVILMVLGRMHLPLGRLPGDFTWRGRRTTVYFPLATMLIISLLLTLMLNLFFRR
jgi:hypothetical protein